MSYLFDTSAARSVGRAQLENARTEGFELLLSPITFSELACHLGDEPFVRPRGNALKGRLFTVLHDPLGELAADVGCPQAANRTRFDDQEAVLAILGELEQADSYVDLASRCVAVRGETRTIGDIASNTEALFDADRVQFVEAQRFRCAAFIERYGRAGTAELTGEQFAREAAGLARGLTEDMTALGCNVQFSTIASRTLLGAGYCVARACRYVAGGAAVEDIVFEGNDLEDYYIRLHLGVSSGRTLVTNDEGMSEAVNRAVAAFKEYWAVSGASFVTNAQVMTSAQFLAAVEAA